MLSVNCLLDKGALKGRNRSILVLSIWVWGQLAVGCNVEYENAALSGCYAMDNTVFHQMWFDGVEQFEEIFWTPESGSVYYSGTYSVSDYELRLDYYSYDSEVYTLVLYANGFTLDGGALYVYVGDECL